MFKQSKGITLVALVITIIVLLILAGVSINFMFGNEGIIGKAQSAVDMYKNAADDEKQLLAEVENYVKENYTTANTRAGEAKDLFGVIATTGNGTQNNPYIISNAKQLQALSGIVNSGEEFSGAYFKISDDVPYIDLSTVCGENLNKVWMPIGHGYNNRFKGNFDGNNKPIKNIYINMDIDGQTTTYTWGHLSGVGLFGAVEGAKIENVIVENSNIITKNICCVGSVVGLAINSTITGCTNKGNVTATVSTNTNVAISIGGIVGLIQNSIVRNSTNEGIIQGQRYVGGIVGYAQNSSEFTGCSNKSTGEVSTTQSGTTPGGICGYVDASTYQKLQSITPQNNSNEYSGVYELGEGDW